MGSFKLAFSHTIRCRFNVAELSAGLLANTNVRLVDTKYWFSRLRCKCGWYVLAKNKKKKEKKKYLRTSAVEEIKRKKEITIC